VEGVVRPGRDIAGAMRVRVHRLRRHAYGVSGRAAHQRRRGASDVDATEVEIDVVTIDNGLGDVRAGWATQLEGRASAGVAMRGKHAWGGGGEVVGAAVVGLAVAVVVEIVETVLDRGGRDFAAAGTERPDAGLRAGVADALVHRVRRTAIAALR